MAFSDALQELKEFDVNELNADNIGSWPIAIKVIVWVIVFVAVLVAGYMYDVSGLQKNLAQEQKKELDLRSEFERKAYQAANLNAYRTQMVQMEESFGALVSQLPSDTEVPGLLEDITNKGLSSGLDINRITLSGNYHDIATFVSGIASLPRIVTLHDFEILQSDDATLNMKITAKTYRYKDLEEDDA